jgi:hypothetical protein
MSGISVQAAGTIGIRGVVIRGNTILGKDPATFLVDNGRLSVGIFVEGATDVVYREQLDPNRLARCLQIHDSRNVKVGPNHFVACRDSAGNDASLEVLSVADSDFVSQMHRETSDAFGQKQCDL